MRLALLAGILAWAGVAAVAVLVVHYWEDENQVLAFIPILAAVVAAWAIGEAVTHRVFAPEREAK
jgi:hypothetical protein